MKRTKQMQEVLDDITTAMFGKSNSDAVKEQVCVICGNPANEFRDEISKREFGISGMCQYCQDGFFN